MGYSSSCSIKIICFFFFIFTDAISSQNASCPFKYFYQFGDGSTDVGNSIRLLPLVLPASRLPYGTTFPGSPTGRWSDGRVNVDYIGPPLGIGVEPSLSQRARTSTGVIFSVEQSPVLDKTFFALRGVIFPPYVVSLRKQLLSFKAYLASVCSSPTDCRNRLRNSLIVIGDIEANDIGYPLSQGKSIQQVQSYVPFIIRTFVETIRELIRMGATRVAISADAPLGCYPYILTALSTNDPSAYDELGCLRSVNDLIVSKNNDLEQAINNLKAEIPTAIILYSPTYEAVRTIINQSRATGTSLTSCCGIGGKYNYDRNRFCGSSRVPVCPNPNQYVYWDGLHFTQETNRRIVDILLPPALAVLNCTS